MSKYLLKNWPFAFIAIGLIILSIFNVANLKYGFFTAYDEAYFLLKLKEGYTLSSITGKSQWNLIVVHWFPYLDLTSKVNSYLASSILIWFTILVMTATCCVLYGKKNFLKYFAIIFLFYYTVSIISMSYIPMHAAVACWALCCFMLFLHSQKKWAKYLFAALCGFFLCLDCFIYIPAGLSILGCTALSIILIYWKDIKTMLFSLLAGIAGILLAMAYVHVFVCNLGDIIDAMLFTAGYIGKSGYNYDSSSIVKQYGFFFRDYIFVIIAFTGAYYLSKAIKNKYFGTILYVALLLIYTHYQSDPSVAHPMFFVSLILIPLLQSSEKAQRGHYLNKNNICLFLYLLIFPFVAAVGTNTTLGSRISCFTIAWLFLYFQREKDQQTKQWNRVLIGVVALAALMIANETKNHDHSNQTCHFTQGNKYFSELYITPKQKEYFDNVYDILEKYNYQPNKSVIFTALFDYCCLYAFDAVNSSNFHQVQNFHFFDKEKMLKPDFIFLCPWDSIVLADELRQMPWGWPEDFDAYHVGSPEPDDAPWVLSPSLEQRTLYCRKQSAAEVPAP